MASIEPSESICPVEVAEYLRAVSSSVSRSLLSARCRLIISTVPAAPSTAESPVWSGIPLIPPLLLQPPKVETFFCWTLRSPQRRVLFKGWVPGTCITHSMRCSGISWLKSAAVLGLKENEIFWGAAADFRAGHLSCYLTTHCYWFSA